jgi:hypothetical protein
MTAKELKTQIVKDAVSKGCNISYELLDNNLDTLIHLARLEALTEARIGVIGQQITEPIEPVTDPQL